MFRRQRGPRKSRDHTLEDVERRDVEIEDLLQTIDAQAEALQGTVAMLARRLKEREARRGRGVSGG